MNVTAWNALTPFSEIRNSLPDDRFVTIDDRDIYVEQAGSGAPLLLLHGFAASSYSFREIIPMLAARHRIIAVDLNGFGFTERPREFQAYGPEAQVKTLFRIMDALDIGEFSVVGHSYGGILGLWSAQNQPRRIRRLALISPPTEFAKPPWYLRSVVGHWGASGMLRLLLSRPQRFRKVLSNAFYQKDIVNDEVAEEYRRRLLVEGLYQSVRGFSKAMSGSRTDFDYDAIHQPVLVVTGYHDAIADPDGAKALAGKFSRSQFRILENSGHSPPEEEPGEVSTILDEFFRRD